MAEPTVRPRLVVVASTYPAGAGDGTPAFVRDLALVESTEFDTTVLVPAVPGGAASEQLGALRVRRFRYFPRRWEDVAHGAILENLRARPSRWLQVPALLLAEGVALARLVRRERPDVLHVHWLVPQGLVALVAGRGVPMVVTTLGGDVYALTDRLSRFLIGAVLRRAAHVTTMNSEMRQRLVDLGAAPSRTHVLPMGADVESVRAAGVGVARVPGRILFVGRLVEKKGLAVLLRAMRQGGEQAGATLRVVGDGPLRASLETSAAALPVEFLGMLAREHLAREYATASVVVFPSVAAASGDQDGLPVAMLEAMAAGCAVIATDLPGLRDAVQDGVSGRVVAPNDADALAAALRTLLADPDERDRLGQAAWQRADEYSVRVIGRAYLDLLHTTVGSRTAVPA